MFIYSIYFIFILLHKEKRLFTLESNFNFDSFFDLTHYITPFKILLKTLYTAFRGNPKFFIPFIAPSTHEK